MAEGWVLLVRRTLSIVIASGAIVAALSGSGCASAEQKDVVIDDRRELPPYQSVDVWAEPADDQPESNIEATTQPAE